jgi:hypothetical protein
MGFGLDDVLAMSEGEVEEWLDVYNETVNPDKQKTYKVRRKDH